MPLTTEKPDPEAVAVDGEPVSDAPEKSSAPSSGRLAAYLSQVLLRVLNMSPGMASYLESYRINPKGDAIELSFYKLPDDMIGPLQMCFGIQKVEVFHYTKNDHPCVGFRATPTRDELSALAIDDADDHQLKQAEDEEAEDKAGGELEKEADKLLVAPEPR